MDVVTCPAIRTATLQGRSGHFPPALTHLGAMSSCRLGETIYYQEDTADYWYQLVSGAARKCTLMRDGRRHIASFLLPGDLFGFGAKQVHRFSVEAIVAGTIVARYPRRRVEMLAESDAEVGRRVREAAFESIAQLQMRMLLLARCNALEKVCAFLLEMADHSASAGDVFELPMSRYDIADYLAIAVETVSRALTMLRSRGAIVLFGTRRIKILDRGALEEGVLNAGTA